MRLPGNRTLRMLLSVWVGCSMVAGPMCNSQSPGGELGNKIRARLAEHNGEASVEVLALKIDRIEKHIDTYGTVVAKQPDVWGQARLMKHRQEYERILAEQLDNFKETIQGSLSRADQAYLASAFSLQAAISGSPAALMPQPPGVSEEIIRRRRLNLQAAGVEEEEIEPDDLLEDPETIEVPEPTDPGSLIQAPSEVIDQNKIERFEPLAFSSDTISLEPVEFLDQLSRYVKHLHQLRRINEGDDTADSPGYALHLVRIPVSILPGKKTRRGYGAEVTITAKPHIGPRLLPETFRSLVVNDLVEHFALPLSEYFNSDSARTGFQRYEILKREVATYAGLDKKRLKSIVHASRTAADRPQFGESNRSAISERSEDLKKRVKKHFRRQYQMAGRPESSELRMLEGFIDDAPGTEKDGEAADKPNAILPGNIEGENLTDGNDIEDKLREIGVQVLSGPINYEIDQGLSLTQYFGGSTAYTIPSSRSRKARLPFPTNQFTEVYGEELILPVANLAYDLFLKERMTLNPRLTGAVPYHKLAGYVQEQVQAAYDFLETEEASSLWSFCTPQLASAVRARNHQYLGQQRAQFLKAIAPVAIEFAPPYESPGENGKSTIPPYTVTAAMAWAIIVECALLNEHLIDDIKNVASAKGCAIPDPEGLPFFLPSPLPEASHIFNEYVRCRFPIHVFTIDPIKQQQNIADQLLLTRELQLALSLGFVSGQISADSLTQFARNLEIQAQTIDLNRTQIGFSHGNGIFGWRFQPRFQTPPTQNNLVALRDTLLGGPTSDQMTRQLELEPGARECVALMIMPSFVPHATFDIRTNWYRLTNPRKTELDAIDFVELSRMYQEAWDLARCCLHPQFYRAGDVNLLFQRLEQLAAELPFQRLMAQVPYENTLGGFELFSTGVTDLAPELLSWYGAPGIRRDAETTLFLSGDNFSVHETSLTIGNIVPDPEKFDLLSRQVVRVTVPAGVETVDNDRYVEAQIATPYGVSQSLKIPVVPPPSSATRPRDAPELTAWSGAPGVDPNGGTTLFLRGRAFDPERTRVTIGTQPADVEFLGESILRVRVSEGIKTMDIGASVVAYVATPRGISEPLVIPVHPGPSRPSSEGPAPVLEAYAGAPGINPNRTTTLFLQGQNFDAQTTQVVVGNLVPEVEVLGPSILRISVPKGARTVDGGQAVEAYAATPKGVSNRLKIDVHRPEQPPGPTSNPTPN